MFANILKSIVVCIVCISNLALDIELHKQVQMWAHLETFFFLLRAVWFQNPRD